MRHWPGKPSEEETGFGSLSRSELMSRIRNRNNATTELRVVSLLRKDRITGWRRHAAIAGKPDFVWYREKVAVFVNGCFWHGHGCGRNLTPRRNAAIWATKIAETKRRDRRNAQALRARGWMVLIIWECRLKKSPLACVRRIKNALERHWDVDENRRHKRERGHDD